VLSGRDTAGYLRALAPGGRRLTVGAGIANGLPDVLGSAVAIDGRRQSVTLVTVSSESSADSKTLV
jgi:hypothetical protein